MSVDAHTPKPPPLICVSPHPTRLATRPGIVIGTGMFNATLLGPGPDGATGGTTSGRRFVPSRAGGQGPAPASASASAAAGAAAGGGGGGLTLAGCLPGVALCGFACLVAACYFLNVYCLSSAYQEVLQAAVRRAVAATAMR